jgi:energy-coupling factor transporter transmembrane protein EcfT
LRCSHLNRALGTLEMKVSSSHHKVIPIKNAILGCLVCFIILFLSFETLKYFISPASDFWLVLYILIRSVFSGIGLYGIKYGYLATKNEIYPPPRTWAVSNWNMYYGSKAIWLGRATSILSIILITLNILIIFESIERFGQ